MVAFPLLRHKTRCSLNIIELQSTHVDGFDVLLLWRSLDILWFWIVDLLDGLVLHGLSLVNLLLELHVVVCYHFLL